MNEYLSKIDSLLDTHVPIENFNKKELKFPTKSWITQGLQNSIKKKNNIYSKFVKYKNKILKEIYHSSYKICRKLLSTLLKRAKEKKQKNNDTPSLIAKDEKYISDPVSIANTFNNLFTSAAESVHLKIKFLIKNQ